MDIKRESNDNLILILYSSRSQHNGTSEWSDQNFIVWKNYDLKCEVAVYRSSRNRNQYDEIKYFSEEQMITIYY